MKLYTAPDITPPKLDLFLAGGISNCPDWQAEVLTNLQTLPDTIQVANPRRFIYDSEEDARKQITWEYDALNKSTTVSFWFPKETLCPITLFELGRFSHDTKTKLLVGVHPDYQRLLDVETQLELARPDVSIVYNLQDLTQQIKETM